MLTPAEAIAEINRAYGQSVGSGTHRSLHAKGRFYAGTFTATPEAAALCRAGHLRGDPVPVWVRWSNGGGDPEIPDKGPDVRGMAVSFRLPDGTATDLLGQTAPRFPVRSPEAFVAMVRAARSPARLPLFHAGTIEVVSRDPEREQDGEVVVFDPARVVDGVELSDDPILRFRPGAYSASVDRRT
jgi:catalase